LQRMLWRLITAPSGVAEGLAGEPKLAAGGLGAIITGDDRMDPQARVGIYAEAYFYRLLDVLKEDFPATLEVAGADQFHNLVTGYLIDYPPTEPSIFYAGQYFARYLRAHPIAARVPFIGDLAHLERIVLESFHAADATALDGAAMRAIAPQAWPAIAMRTHPAMHLVACAWRVDEVLRAIEDDRAWHAPARTSATIVVWRRAARVYYRAAEPAESAALALADVDSGTTFGAICTAIAESAQAHDDVPGLIQQLLGRWLDDGILIDGSLTGGNFTGGKMVDIAR
jgi:hypothetical protein